MKWNCKLQLAWMVILVISEVSFVCSGGLSSVAGPYRIIPGHIEHCPRELESDESMDIHITARRDRKNADLWYYSANFTTTFEWNNNLSVDMRMASWSSRGGWKDNAHVLKLKHVCQALKDYIPAFNRGLMKAMYGDENRTCPFPPGTYVITNKTSDTSVAPVPTFFYGKWRIDFRLMDPDFEPQKFRQGQCPYRIILGHVEHCPKELDSDETMDIHFTGWRDRKNTDLWYYSANFTTAFEWNNNLDVDMRMASWSSQGRWKDNAHVIKLKHVCQAMKDYVPEFNRNLMKVMHGDENRSCPFPPGTYVITNKTTDTSVAPAPTFFYGKWRVDLRLMDPDTQKCVGCIRILAETVPKV